MISMATHRVGLADIIIPIMSGIAISKILPNLYGVKNTRLQTIRIKFWQTSSVNRFLLVIPFVWIFGVYVFVWLFEPYGHYMSSLDRTHEYKIMLFPPVMLLFFYVIYSKLIAPKNNLSKKN